MDMGTFHVYDLEYVFTMAQQLSDSGRFEPMGLSSYVKDKDAVADKLDQCKFSTDDENKCVRKVLNDFTRIYQTYTEDRRGPHTTTMVEIDGDRKTINLTHLVGNVLPITSNFYLATDWHKGTVTSFISNHYDFAAGERLLYSRRGRTLKLSGGESIGAITRDMDSLIARVGQDLRIFPLNNFFLKEDNYLPTMSGIWPTKCLDNIASGPQHKPYDKVFLNEIDYDSYSGRFWGVTKNSDRILEFDRTSNACIGEINFNDALQKFCSQMTSQASPCKTKPELDDLMKMRDISVTAVAGINFIAKNWLIVSPWNSSIRFIVKLKEFYRQRDLPGAELLIMGS